MTWTSTKDKLPASSGDVLICANTGHIFLVNYSKKHNQFNNFDDLPFDDRNLFNDAVAWMPLPEPYEDTIK